MRLAELGERRDETPFAERIDVAAALLAEEPGDIVYVVSAATSEFIVAAKSAGRTTVLNIYEKAHELHHLLQHDLLKLDVLALCDGVVLGASEEQRRDLEEVFGNVPERCLDFGNAFDIAEIEAAARDDRTPARNAAGQTLRWGDRLVIGMCGHASPRKGADIFYAAAASCPEHDFVWVGNWDAEDAVENPVSARYIKERLPNLYVTGGVDNPYKYIRRFDLFFLSSREDPNPLVLSEALLLRVPVLAFSRTTAVTDFLGRSGILCHGTTNSEDAVRVLQALDPEEIRSPAFRGLTDRHRDRFDIALRVGELVAFLGAL